MQPDRDEREAIEHMFKGNNSHVLALKSYLDRLENAYLNTALQSVENENNTSAALGGLNAVKSLRETLLLK